MTGRRNSAFCSQIVATCAEPKPEPLVPSQSPNASIVELNRTYVPATELNRTLVLDQTQLHWSLSHLKGEECRWEDIADNPCTIILGEALSGKTTEFKRARELQSVTSKAVMVNVDEAAVEGLSLEMDNQQIEDWRQSDKSMWVFLDSVDEAMEHNRTLRAAIRKVRNCVGIKHWHRIRMVISCRATDWDHSAQMEQLESLYPSERSPGAEPNQPSVPPNESHANPHDSAQSPIDAKSPIRVLYLTPLSEAQVEALVNSRLSKARAQAFLSELPHSGAQGLTSRPGDVLSLLDHWIENGAFGSLSQLLESTVSRMLTEALNKAKTVAASKAQLAKAAERMAAATYLSAHSVFSAPEHANAGQYINGKDVLQDFPTTHLAILQQSAIFDTPTYGRIRFHHRTLREYLAARWLHDLLTRGHPLRSVLTLLFRTDNETSISIASRQPLLAWLAQWNDRVRDLAVQSSPTTLMKFGDTRSLSLATKKAVLNSLAKPGQSGATGSWLYDDREAVRFVEPGLDSTVLGLLERTGRDSVKAELITLARVGQFKVCWRILLQLAESSNEHLKTRILAIRALAALKATEEQPSIMARLAIAVTGTPDLTAAMCISFFPGPLPISKLLAAMHATYQSPREIGGPAWTISRHIGKACPEDQINELISTFQGLLPKNSWVVEPLTRLGLRLARTPRSQKDWEQLEQLFDLTRDHPQYEQPELIHKDFLQTLLSDATVRRHLFWRDIAKLRQTQSGLRTTRWDRIPFPSLQGVNPSTGDLAWLLEDAANSTSLYDRLLALSFCLMLASTQEDLTEVERVARTDEALRVRWMRTQTRRQNGPEDPAQSTWKRREKATTLREKRRIDKSRESLSDQIDSIRSGAFGPLFWLYNEVARRDNATKYGKADISAIGQLFGNEILAAARAGFIRYWQTFRPSLAHERAHPNRPENGLLVGLTGLEQASQSDFIWSQLTPAKAEIASRYALGELNGYPHWFGELADAHPTSVVKTLNAAISVELATPLDQEAPYGALAKLRYADPSIRELSATPVLAGLQEAPHHPEVLRQALEVLLECGADSRSALRQRAIAELKKPIAASWTNWWPTLFRIDATTATEVLSARRDSQLPLPADITTSILGAIEHHLHDAPAASLLALAKISYSEIKPEEDIHRKGTFAYDARDYAQETRSRLVQQLGSLPNTSDLLTELAQYPDAKLHKGWITRASHTRLSQDVELAPLSSSQIFVLATEFITPPKSTAQLMSTMLARISDIDHDMRSSRFTIRGLFRCFDKESNKFQSVAESEVQRWLAHELSLRSYGHYQVEREPEDIDQKRPDLAVALPAAGRIPIEIKCADSWSARELGDAIGNQLSKRYMRHRDTTHGIFLVTRASKLHWIPPDKKKLDFARLTTHLQSVADNVAKKLGWQQISVVAIDYLPQ